jgi:hypothetical protein
MRLVAWATVIFEKAVMRETKELAGVLGDDCTTEMRLFDCWGVRAAANDTDGTKRKTARTVVIFFIVIFISIYKATGESLFTQKTHHMGGDFRLPYRFPDMAGYSRSHMMGFLCCIQTFSHAAGCPTV